MKNLNYLIGGFIFSTALLTTSCNDTDKTAGLKNSPEYNIIASVQNPVGLFTVDVMDLLKKSNIKESKEMPIQFKMIVNSQIDQHFNSENQGFELEGNIPFAISTTDNNEFNYIMSSFNVLDAEKIGPSLSLYLEGEIVKSENNYNLAFIVPGSPLKGTFTWDNEKMVLVVSETANTKSISAELLANKNIDASENEKITALLAKDNDFSSLLFMDIYTKMANQLSHTEMNEELIAAYKGMTMVGIGNFNNGNLKFESELEGDHFIDSKFNNLNNTPINTEYTNYLTENGQLIAFGGASLNLEGLVNVIKHTKYEDNQYEEVLTAMGLEVADLTTIFDGDFSASLMDIESIPTQGNEGNLAFNKERPKFLLSCGLKDVEKIEGLLTNNEKIQIVDDYFKIDDAFIGIYANKIFLSLNEELIQKLTNGEKLIPYKAGFSSPINGEFITNINLLPESFKTVLLHRNGGEELLKTYNMLENVTFTGDVQHTELNIDLTDQSKNSFEVLSNILLKNILPLILNGML